MTELTTPSPNPAHDTGQLPGLSLEERALLAKMFSDPMSIPPEWKAWLVSYLEANPPVLPISQIHGFSSFTANFDEQSTSAAITTANTWQDLSASGPDLTALPKGSYILLYGCNYDASFGATGYMGACINGATTPSFFVSIAPVNVERFLLMKANVVDLTEDTNSIHFKYQASQVGPSFANRWMIALKYANL